MKVALYVRRSTIDLQPDSLEAQEERLRSHAAASGHEVVRVYSDSASGKRVEKRDAFQRLIGDVKRGPDFEAVLVRDVSRWSRAENTPATPSAPSRPATTRPSRTSGSRWRRGIPRRLRRARRRETPASLPAFVDPQALRGPTGKVRWLRDRAIRPTEFSERGRGFNLLWAAEERRNAISAIRAVNEPENGGAWHRISPWPAGRVASRASGRCAARFVSPVSGPVLGSSSFIGEMASRLPAWEDDEERPEEDRGAPESAPRRSDQSIHECRHGPERPTRPRVASAPGGLVLERHPDPYRQTTPSVEIPVLLRQPLTGLKHNELAIWVVRIRPGPQDVPPAHEAEDCLQRGCSSSISLLHAALCQRVEETPFRGKPNEAATSHHKIDLDDIGTRIGTARVLVSKEKPRAGRLLPFGELLDLHEICRVAESRGASVDVAYEQATQRHQIGLRSRESRLWCQQTQDEKWGDPPKQQHLHLLLGELQPDCPIARDREPVLLPVPLKFSVEGLDDTPDRLSPLEIG